MATTNSLNHHHHHHHLSLLKPTSPPSSLSSSLFLKPSTPATTTTTTLSLNSTTAFSLSSSFTTATTTTTSSTQPITFDLLQTHLSAQNFRKADEETRRLLIALAGESAVKRGYVFFSEVKFIPDADLKAIDDLWRKYSNNKFGYSVQRKIWLKTDKDFSKFFVKIGWMKKLDTEVLQYNYRAFPDEFVWEINEADNTPAEGHLPLTNALRGTQLLKCVLSHPVFEAMDEENEEDGIKQSTGEDKSSSGGGVKVFKTNYSF